MRNLSLRRLLSIGFWLICSGAVQAAEEGNFEPLGSLIIVGGGDTPLLVQERLVELAGGPGQARIAVLPMATNGPGMAAWTCVSGEMGHPAWQWPVTRRG